jgi:MFS family permease
VALGSFLVPLNSTMIAIALPSLIEDFRTSLASVSWLVTAYLVASYLVTMAVLQPLGGRLGDRVGQRPLLLAGLAGFGAASVGAMAAPSLTALAACRVGQAAAGALIVPNGIALLRATSPPQRLGSRMGILSATMPLGAAVGPPLGGLLLTLGSWRLLFLTNLPLLAVAFALAWRSLPRAPGGARRRAADAGAAGPSPRPGAGFFAGVGAVALSNLAMYTTLLAVPLLLARRGWSSDSAGLALGSLPLAAFLFSIVGGRLSDRFGRRAPAAAGLALLACALVPIAVAPGTIAGSALVAGLIGAGVGIGLATPSLQVATIESVPPQATGMAAGIFSTSRYVGSIAGTALLAGPLAPPADGTGGFTPLFAALIVAGVGATLLAMAMPSRSPEVLAPAS